MTIITIEVKWNMLKVHYGKMKKARKEWYAAGLEVYVMGAMKGGLYGQVANLAMNFAEGIHIPASSLRRVTHGSREVFEKPRLINEEGLSLKKRLL